MRILLAPDTFKGTLSATEVSRAMARGAKLYEPTAEIDIAPMSDGGRGFAGRMLAAIGGETGSVSVEDQTGRIIEAEIAWLSDRRAAFDVASVCGLRGAPTPDEALRASTFGVGQVLLHAARSDRPLTSVIIGIGDTATTDGGTGAARAVGWRFLDRAGADLAPGGAALRALASIVRPPDPPDPGLHIVGGCDVSSGLLGPEGAARRFAPQKGAGSREVGRLEAGLERLEVVIHSDLGVAVGALSGAGAGGGLGAGLVAFFGATIGSGFDIVAEASRIDERLARADVVLTGEGALDASSFAGKVTGRVARRAHAMGVPCAVITGRVEASPEQLSHVGISVQTLDPLEGPAPGVSKATQRALQGLLD
ncbi:MAG: glycerate kinase [Actinobacteria bacterium]|nr:glycerate kinase [Actinomycetota bacterium]